MALNPKRKEFWFCKSHSKRLSCLSFQPFYTLLDGVKKKEAKCSGQVTVQKNWSNLTCQAYIQAHSAHEAVKMSDVTARTNSDHISYEQANNDRRIVALRP